MKLQFDDAVEVIEGVCRNISIGGMQVLCDSPRSRGTLVRFELEIDDALTIRGLGEVVWMRAEEGAAPGREPGMGIKFRFIEQRDRQVIFKLVSEHIKERLEQKHPSMEEVAETPPAAPAGAEPTPAPATVSASPDLDSSFLTVEPKSRHQVPTGPAAAATEVRSDLPSLTREAPPEPREPVRVRSETRNLYRRPRPARRRDLPTVPAVLILLLVGVALVYLYRDEIFGPPAPAPVVAPPPPRMAPPPAAVSQPSPEAGVEGSIVPAGEPPVDESPPLSVASAPPPPSPPPPPPPSPPPAETALPAFTRVVDISWTRRPGGIKVEIDTDGRIPEGRYSHFRLDGENPREVVRLTGVVSQFSPSEISVEGSPVSRIRVGYHPQPRELHVVLDMLDRSTRISRIRSRGSKLEVFLE